MFTTFTHRLSSLVIAASLTLSMLTGIDALASSTPNPALLATISAQSKG